MKEKCISLWKIAITTKRKMLHALAQKKKQKPFVIGEMLLLGKTNKYVGIVFLMRNG